MRGVIANHVKRLVCFGVKQRQGSKLLVRNPGSKLVKRSAVGVERRAVFHGRVTSVAVFVAARGKEPYAARAPCVAGLKPFHCIDCRRLEKCDILGVDVFGLRERI